MSVVIGDGLVLSSIGILNPNQPRLCWRNFVNEDDVSVTSQTDANPVTNLTNPSTAFIWQATSTAQQDIDFVISQPIDYIGIARHNLSGSAEIRIQFLVGGDYVTVFDWSPVPNRQVLLYLLNQATPDGVRISIRNNNNPPIIGVVYIGEATILERRIYVGHTPIVYGRQVETVGGFSENGQYLGELIRRESRSTQLTMQNLTPRFYRDELDPFLAQRPRRPAFFAWRPESYPTEVGYVWLTGSPQPQNQRPNGMMEISLNMDGIA